MANSSPYSFWCIDWAVSGATLGLMAGKGAGDGDRPPRIPVAAVNSGEPAFIEEKEDRLDPETFMGGCITDSGVEGMGVLLALDIWVKLDPAGSGISEARVTTEPASEAVDARRFIEGRRELNEGGLEDRISIFRCDEGLPALSLTKGLMCKELLRWLTECTCTDLSLL